jgi:hypothetical protein
MKAEWKMLKWLITVRAIYPMITLPLSL